MSMSLVPVFVVAHTPLCSARQWFMLPQSSQFTDERHSNSCRNLRWLLYNLVWAFKVKECLRCDLQTCYKPTDGFEHQRSQCFGDLNYVRTCFWVYLWRFSEWCFSGRMGWMGTTCSGTWAAVRLLFARVRCMWQLREWHTGGCNAPQFVLHYIRSPERHTMFDELWSEIQDAPGEIFDLDIPELRDDEKFDVNEYILSNIDYWWTSSLLMISTTSFVWLKTTTSTMTMRIKSSGMTFSFVCNKPTATV